ncbi:ATP-dependent helicase [Acanthopleuribacter pedis]|uniref:DNA 3'-5' helicase n=1 Tax=Acanthopleuribacter pedis TaxID=442870 RepID=A0A8J7Q9B6_9BACT|nr:UvrD-helicase domain-containing protein [Acanthopleuribacter pedis]MBO1319809.1 UvrD-helicase domain-containing protein [Acanthopleuribacter pedis]
MQDQLEQLNPQQRAAVEAVDGPVLVVAGAGSGKTKVITTRIMYLIHKGVSPYQILAMTFTNKAAQEMRERIERAVGSDARDLTITTFHSFCAMFLRREIGYLDRDSNFVIYDTSDQTSCLKRVIRNMDLEEKNYPAQRLRSRISYLKNAGDLGGELNNPVEQLIYKNYQEELLAQNALDFDDLLHLTCQILERWGEVQQRYRHRFEYIMVDEYQDTNQIQSKLINLLLNEQHNLCVVGDEDQSIYGWRGADITNILHFDKNFRNTRVFKLEQNYRSTQSILDYANAVINKNKLRKPKKLWTAAGEGLPIIIKDEYTASIEAENIIQQIRSLSRNNNLAYNQFAILFRSNALSRVLEETARRYRIPYQLIGGLKFYDRKEIKDLLSYMRIVVNPRDWTSFVRALGVPTRGIGAKSQDKLYSYFEEGSPIPDVMARAIKDKRLSGKGMKGLKEFQILYRDLVASAETDKPSEWLKKLVDRLDYQAYLEKLDITTTDSRLDNLQELMTGMLEQEAQGVTTLSQFMDFSALVSDQDDLNPDEPRVNMMTVHAAKGLEFDTVFVVGLEDGVFPNQRALDDNPNAVEEERRLFYVAVTRAKQRLFLSYARSRQTYGKTVRNIKSRFLLPPKTGADSGPLPEKPRKPSPWGDSATQQKRLTLQMERLGVDARQIKKTFGKSEDGDELHLEPGDRVEHASFGEGTVSVVMGQGAQRKVSVRFPGKGIRTLLVIKAGLKKL